MKYNPIRKSQKITEIIIDKVKESKLPEQQNAEGERDLISFEFKLKY